MPTIVTKFVSVNVVKAFAVPVIPEFNIIAGILNVVNEAADVMVIKFPQTK